MPCANLLNRCLPDAQEYCFFLKIVQCLTNRNLPLTRQRRRKCQSSTAHESLEEAAALYDIYERVLPINDKGLCKMSKEKLVSATQNCQLERQLQWLK